MNLRVLNKRRLSPDADDDPTLIYVGRPSPWGNPYREGQIVPVGYSDRPQPHRLTREEAVASFLTYAERRLAREPHWLDPLREATALVCWCAPRPCHAEVLVELLASLPPLAASSPVPERT